MIIYNKMKQVKRFLSLPLLLMVVFLVVAISCDFEDNNNGLENIPILSSTEVIEITQTTATSGGNISDDGGLTVTARGVCWSTNENPTIDDNKTEDGTGAGSFTSSITGLEPNTNYYLRAYATNIAGTGYGSTMSFTTLEGNSGSTFTDPRDGKVYQTVIIGNQEWMAENLAYAPSSGNYWAYDNDDANVEIYGYLYNWVTALTVCPSGWHLPSDEEWKELTDYLGGEEVAGGKLKATGTIEAGTGLWNSPNTGASNETGFTALPAGTGGANGTSYFIGARGIWWSTNEVSNMPNSAWSRSVGSSYTDAYRGYDYKTKRYSVRCVKD